MVNLKLWDNERKYFSRYTEQIPVEYSVWKPIFPKIYPKNEAGDSYKNDFDENSVVLLYCTATADDNAGIWIAYSHHKGCDEAASRTWIGELPYR